MSHHEYVPHCVRFELKLGMRGEEGLLTNFFKFHGDLATSTMFSQRCRKTYRTNLIDTGTEVCNLYEEKRKRNLLRKN